MLQHKMKVYVQVLVYTKTKTKVTKYDSSENWKRKKKEIKKTINKVSYGVFIH